MAYQQMIERALTHKGTMDPALANTLALELSMASIDALSEAARRELSRGDLLNGIMQRIMDEQGMAKTPAEKEARGTAQYKEYVEGIQNLNVTGDRLRALARYFDTQAALAQAEKEMVAHA